MTSLFITGMPIGIAVFPAISTYQNENRHAAAFLRYGMSWQTSRKTILYPPAHSEFEWVGDAGRVE
ncbi:hypothetical protein ACIBP6_35560 [Nonomuraea terrae]|uniref:hypothetical protein n=1 Tax=Nonomuraea terrae TaxID=2530383 RepID=UPI0037A1FF75